MGDNKSDVVGKISALIKKNRLMIIISLVIASVLISGITYQLIFDKISPGTAKTTPSIAKPSSTMGKADFLNCLKSHIIKAMYFRKEVKIFEMN